MRRPVHVCLYSDLSKPESAYRVRIEREDSPERADLNGLVLCSHSPIFPTSDTRFVPKKSDSFRIIFFVHNQPFTQLGRLNREVRKYFWFTLGLTSLVAIIPITVSDKPLFSALAMSEVLCHETWHVRKGIVIKPQTRVLGTKGKQTQVSWVEQQPKDKDLKKLVQELRFNFNFLFKRARIFMPSLLPVLDKVSRSAGEAIEGIINEESSLLQTQQKSPQVTQRHAEQVDRKLLCHKKINVSVDVLVQLNSALSYILSQSFYGGPPLTRNLALNSCHSLLGIGTAISAIQKLTEFIIRGFSKWPLATAIKGHYSYLAVEAFLKTTAKPPNAVSIDRFISSEAEQTPKLAYFSTRMGFSEHSYCVTAATQSLSCADGARRNVLTLTHELLHSHVKGIFATLLAGGDEQTEALTQHLKDHLNKAKQYSSEPRCQTKWTVLEYLRFRVFLFCDSIYKITEEYPGCVITTAPKREIGFGPAADIHEEEERFRGSFGFLNEIIVHVLDVHYFYDESQAIYLSALWKSWATVPGVADRIEWYILRGLVAVSVINMDRMNRDDFSGIAEVLERDPKSIGQRFKEAVSTLISVLEELCAKGESQPVLHAVLIRLQSEPTKNWLREAFVPCHLFAQVVKQFMYSPSLRKYFDSLKDPMADRDEAGDPVYRLDSCEFPRALIKNPIAFLRDRLRRDIDGGDPFDEEIRSAWLFLGLSSIPNSETT